MCIRDRASTWRGPPQVLLGHVEHTPGLLRDVGRLRGRVERAALQHARELSNLVVASSVLLHVDAWARDKVDNGRSVLAVLPNRVFIVEPTQHPLDWIPQHSHRDERLLLNVSINRVWNIPREREQRCLVPAGKQNLAANQLESWRAKI